MATKVWESSIIESPIAEVWKLVRDLNFAWNPLIVTVGPADEGVVGAEKKVTYKDGTVQTIKRVEISDLRTTVSWDVIASEPAVSYFAASHTIRLRRVTSDNTTFAEWTTDFSSDATVGVIEDARFKQAENFQQLARWFSVRRLAVFTDGSPLAEKAVQRAIAAKKPNDRLYIVNAPQSVGVAKSGVLDLAPISSEYFEQANQQIKKQSEELLAGYRKYLTEQKVTNVETLSLPFGDHKQNSIEFLESRHISLAYAGSRGLNPVKASVLGSFSSFLVHHAPCPIHVVK